METRLIEIEEQLKKMNEVMETLQQENGGMKWKNIAYSEGATPDHSKQPEGELQSVSQTNLEEP